MRLLIVTIAASLLLSCKCLSSAVSENEPATNQMQILGQLITVLQESGIDGLTSRFEAKEETGYYLREARLLGRYPTQSGFRLVLRAVFIRSSPYRAGAITPPRGHTFLIVFNDRPAYLAHRPIGYDQEITIEDGKIILPGGGWDLANPKGPE